MPATLAIVMFFGSSRISPPWPALTSAAIASVSPAESSMKPPCPPAPCVAKTLPATVFTLSAHRMISPPSPPAP